MNRIGIFTTTVLGAVGLVTAERLRADETPASAVAPFDGAKAQELQQQWGKHLGKPVVETNSIGLKMTLIPPGEFLMGGTEAMVDTLLSEAKQLWTKEPRKNKLYKIRFIRQKRAPQQPRHKNGFAAGFSKA